jgi:hypothetical protein
MPDNHHMLGTPTILGGLVRIHESVVETQREFWYAIGLRSMVVSFMAHVGLGR